MVAAVMVFEVAHGIRATTSGVIISLLPKGTATQMLIIEMFVMKVLVMLEVLRIPIVSDTTDVPVVLVRKNGKDRKS